MVQIAHLNFGVLVADWSDPRVSGFTNNLDMVNRIAAKSPGFLHRRAMTLADERAIFGLFGQDVTGATPDRMAATLSVWDSAEALLHFTYRTAHGKFLRRKANWFLPLDRPTYVIWPVPDGHRPDLIEARARLDLMEAEGPGPEAHDFAYLEASQHAAEERWI